jgi:hypothetical protein
MCYNEDFVILPRYVFNSLSKWYECNKVIELTVHKLKISENVRIAGSRI